MESLMVSAGVVALAEMGDKTQLLALLLAARFGKPLTILAGIAVATLANHALAGLAGHFIGDLLEGPWFRWIVGLSFLAVAAWILVPDKLEQGPGAERPAGIGWGAFTATLIGFFLVEIGDKTQIATVALAARFQALFAVVAGTTLGLVLANLPAVFMGEALARRFALDKLRFLAAVLFAALGALVLAGVGLGF